MARGITLRPPRDRAVAALFVVFMFVVVVFGYLAFQQGRTSDRISRTDTQNCLTNRANDVSFNRLLGQLSFNLRQSKTQTPTEIQAGLALYAGAHRTLETC